MVAGPVICSDRSTLLLTVVVAVALLLPGVESSTVLVTLATLEIVVVVSNPDGPARVPVTIRASPATKWGNVHGNAVQPPPVTLTSVNPAGVGSDRTTFDTVTGPLLRTPSV